MIITRSTATLDLFRRLRIYLVSLFELPNSKHRLLPMEGLRGVSALLVFFVHFEALFGSYAGHSFLHAVSYFMGTIGHCGVDIFFALSGFLIYGMILENPYNYFRFVRRRIVRIYPTFLAVLLLYLIAAVVVPSYSKLPKDHGQMLTYIIANLLMLPGLFAIPPIITVAWSLSYEIYFYLTLPLISRVLKIWLWPRVWRVTFFLTVCASQLCLSAFGLSRHPRLIMFACGMILREVHNGRIKWGSWGDLLALTLFTATLMFSGLQGRPMMAVCCGSAQAVYSIHFLCLLFIATFTLAYFTLVGNNVLARIFSLSGLRWFGNMSYSYYLTHGLALHTLSVVVRLIRLPAELSAVSFVELFLVSFAATVAASTGVFLLVERPSAFPRAVALTPVRRVPVGA